MARSWIAVLAGSAMALSLVTGCRAPGPSPEETSSASLTGETSADGPTGDSTTPDEETTPQEETSGTEKTGATEAAQAVVTPRLPIGGDSSDEGTAEQCARASFLGEEQNDIPEGVGIAVTGAVFTEGIFEVGGDGCTNVDDPPCLDGFVFTTHDRGRCSVPVRTDATRTPDENGPQDELSLSGRFLCPDELTSDCRDLAKRLARDDQTIKLKAPLAETTDSTTESTETTQSTSESATSESTSGTTTSSAGGG